ncbi:MAG: hypothetical protein KGL54_04780 [Sphingomonadales bacterium]|nr:hypothetical protein [Sphingomonadales bacterium]
MLRSVVLAGLAASAAGCAAMATAEPSPGPLIVEPEGVVSGTVQGQPARLRIQPNGSSTLVLNPDPASRWHLKSGWIGVVVGVGPVKVRGSTAVVRYGVGGVEWRRRIAWFERPAALRADGLLGPTALPHPVVVFRLRPPLAGERQTVLPLVDQGYGGVGTWLTLGQRRVFVNWALDKPATTTTAAAGADLALAYGGRLVGPASSLAFSFGVERPVRQLELVQPLELGPLRLSRVLVRTTDYGNASAIPSAEADASEIVVTAKGRGRRPLSVMQIGTEAMANCSSLAIDKRRRQIILTCR